LVVDNGQDAHQARLALARIGFDEVVGYCEAAALTRLQQLSQLSAGDLKAGFGHGEAPLVLDVRAPAEWRQAHLEGALHIPLPALAQRARELPERRPLAVICASGYRSSIAASFLQGRGFQGLQNVMGGMAAYAAADGVAFTPAGLTGEDGI
jgi:rhodanese-related sulfurtransferase